MGTGLRVDDEYPRPTHGVGRQFMRHRVPGKLTVLVLDSLARQWTGDAQRLGQRYGGIPTGVRIDLTAGGKREQQRTNRGRNAKVSQPAPTQFRERHHASFLELKVLTSMMAALVATGSAWRK
ncbi:protein of unknown function (plasmid) [Cupriavidus taiwanensis]|uniref:Uncharacterized protein n=1 Tax=Cupriavidus taiwanensis TaxID=164546 RepID=A0A7Z7JE51_9BURK|nr:hypothetical protein CBM2585_B110054 [Cupriavidus taiwanensis]SOZ10614.1 protein of unknown function [Cupriavidus taiwanensis]SOZ12796.1 protein of unknown function [Cupriavidus taiwanensis]SOZ41288.1 protein of unknown function [Cupriavidus taiwanensis]SPC23562.1 protein of unknown function [Cupriavidus taiwanensis]